MAKTIEKAMLGLLMVFVIGMGSLLVSAAVTNKSPTGFLSSIQVADSGDGTTLQISEAEESAQLAPLAKITKEEAIAAAMTYSTGTVIDAELDNEDGNLVYSIEMDYNQNVFDVKVDAGNGVVLKIETDDVNDMEENDGAETEQGSDFEQDGIDHQFEGDEGDHED